MGGPGSGPRKGGGRIKFSASNKGTAGKKPSSDPDVAYRRAKRMHGKRLADQWYGKK